MFDLVYPASPAVVLPKPTADKPADRPAPGTEMLPVIDENGIVYAHLHILNRYDQRYLQKRSMKKDLLPGRWDTAVGGHIDYGEYVSEALFRESGEELKFTEYNPIWLGNYIFQSDVERELINIFAAVGNFTPHPDLDEVAEGRYWSMDEIEENLGKSIFTPNFEGEFRKIRKSLEALL